MVSETLLQQLIALGKKPALYEAGEELFWDDPHISRQMLAAHLDPDTAAASRRHTTIDCTVEWLVDQLQLQPGDSVLDLGCGPGLHSERLAQRGLQVTGVDYSRRSLRYARNRLEQGAVDVADPGSLEYSCQNYLTLDEHEAFEAVFLIFCDFGALVRTDQEQLLARVFRALRPGGAFVFDVLTERGRLESRVEEGWSAQESGFWRPNPHLLLTKAFHYPQHDVGLDQYVVLEKGDQLTVYRNWAHYFTPQTLGILLEGPGFEPESFWGSLQGTSYCEANSTCLGVVARKPSVS